VNAPVGQSFDLFISYSHDDENAVEGMLHQELLRCRTRGGRPPRVFLDANPDSIPAGQESFPAIVEAIEACRYFVPVLSNAYLASQPCRSELNIATGRQRLGDGWPRVIPLKLGRFDPAMLPPVIRHIQYLPMQGPSWFLELCRQLELTREVTAVRLAFRTRPADITAHALLQPVEVTVDGDPAAGSLAVTLTAEPGVLQGTSTRPVTDGVATFDDLSFVGPEPRTRLVASCSGSAAGAVSESFTVSPRQLVQRPPDTDDRRVGPPGEVRFLTDHRLLILRPGRVELTDGAGDVLASTHLDGPVRFVRRAGTVAVVVTWRGRVLIGTAEGALSAWDLGGRSGFAVPGDAAIGHHHVDVGFWEGTVHRIPLHGERRPERVLEEPSGVQALEVAAGRHYVFGLDGWLRAYERGRLVAARELEPVIRLLRAFDQWLLVVGTSTLYRLSLDLDDVHPESLRSDVLGVVGDSDLPVVVGFDGVGFRVDEQLTLLRPFRAAPGARPCSADQRGHRCTLRNPDGSGVLVDGERVVSSHPGSTLVVSPSGEWLALAGSAGIDVVPTPAVAGS
jgi:hypothetical protein